MRITIRKKLALSFSIVILVLLLGTLIGVYQMRRSSDILKKVSQRHLALAIEGMAVRANLAEIVWRTKNIFLRGEKLNEIRLNLQEIDEKKKQLDGWNLLVAEHLSTEDIEIPLSLRNHYTNYKMKLSEYTSAWDEALPVYTIAGATEADKIMNRIENQIGKQIYLLATEFRRIAYEELDNAIKISNLAIIITIIAVIASGIFALFVSMVLSGKINKAVVHLKTAADEISHGNLENALKPISQDELGDLAVSFERMRKSFIKIIDRLERITK